MTQLLLKANRVILRADQEPVADGAVLVEDGKILAAGPASEVREQTAPGAVVREFADSTLLPGLIDAHIHLAFDGTESTVTTMISEDDATQVLAMASRAERMVKSGVTTARDLGDRNFLGARLRDAIAAGLLTGPRLQVANAPITVTGGHCWFLGGEADSIDEIRKQVRLNLKNGADVIKVMAGGGNMTPRSVPTGTAQFTVEELRVVAEEARRFGRTSAAHSHNAESTARAVEAGIDCIEHCGWGTASGELDRRPEVVEKMLNQGTYVSPTIGAVLTRPPYDVFAEPVINNLRWYRETGITLIGSTDAGAIGTETHEYALTFPLWIEAGYTPAELLKILTLNSAEALQIGNETGQLSIGFDADIIAVPGDPLKDISTLGRVSYVMARGREALPYTPETQKHATEKGQ